MSNGPAIIDKAFNSEKQQCKYCDFKRFCKSKSQWKNCDVNYIIELQRKEENR